MNAALAKLKIAANMVANTTNIFSLATKNSGLVTTLATRFLFDLDLTFHLTLLCFHHKKMCQIAYTKPVYLQIYTDFCP